MAIQPLAALVALVALFALAAPAVAETMIVNDEALSNRLREITLMSDALERETTLRVLLPTGYEADRQAEYPVLYLYHGCCDDYRSWSDKTDLEQFTAGMDLIVVMPDAGPGGFFTDWFNNGDFGQPRWESYHIGELIPWVEQTYNACTRRSCRMIIGLSMGGFGSLSHAARHPDLFVAAAAFSGSVHTTFDEPGGPAGIEAIAIGFDEAEPGSLWGRYAEHEVRWRGDNPWDLASNLTDVELELRTGNGFPGGPLGNGSLPGGFDALEIGVHELMVALHDQLVELGIDHVWDDYGPGAHTWPYWERDLHQTLPTFLEVVSEGRSNPSSFSFRAIEPSYDIFGWSIVFARDVLEFSEIRNASNTGFTLVGTGMAAVRTAPTLVPGAVYLVKVGDASSLELTADQQGRLLINVPLGPASAFQQYTPPADALQLANGADYFTTVEVSFALASAPTLTPTPGPSNAQTPTEPLPTTGGGAVLLGSALFLLTLRGLRRGR